MATKGLSYMVAGKYAVSQGALSISEGKVLGKAISYSISLDAPQKNDLYADNEIAESDNPVFTTGTLSLNPAEFSPTNMAWMMGQTARSVTLGSGTDSTTFSVYDYDDDMTPIQAAVGLIEYRQVSNADKYVAIILNRVQFKVPAESATTKGETVNWQTPTCEADILRDETEKKRWMTKSDYFSTEAAAKAYLNSVFGIS